MEVDNAIRYIELVEVLAKNIVAFNSIASNIIPAEFHNEMWYKKFLANVKDCDNEIKYILEKNPNSVKRRDYG